MLTPFAQPVAKARRKPMALFPGPVGTCVLAVILALYMHLLTGRRTRLDGQGGLLAPRGFGHAHHSHALLAQHASLVVAVMNRPEPVLRCLPTWLAIPQISEVVIVDWSSSVPLHSLVPKSPKVAHVRVEGERFWNLARAYNLAIASATNEHVLKVDADTCIHNTSVIESHPLPQDTFYAGNWQLASNENERHFNGLVFVRKSDFFAVAGYDERIYSYGWEDDDLYLRMVNFGMVRATIHMPLFTHVPHNDSLRTALTARNIPGSVADVEVLTNKMLTERVGPWGPDRQRCTWKLSKKQPHAYTIATKRACSKPLPELAGRGFSDIALNVSRTVLGYSSHLSRDFINTLSLERITDLLKIYYHQSTDKWLIIHAQNGLGNRLRALGSAMAVAKATGRKLKLIWQNDIHMHAQFPDLFNVDQDQFTVSSQFDPRELDELKVVQYDYMGRDMYRLIDETTPSHIYVRSPFQLNHSSVTISSVMHALNTLVPVPEVTELAQSVSSRWGMDHTVGMHIRSVLPTVEIPNLSSTEYDAKSWYLLRR
jgi:hypothetical protein